MASLQNRNGSYKLTFSYQGKRYYFTIGEVPEREAENWSASVDQVLLRLNQGFVHVPDDTDLVTFVKNGGKVEKPKAKRPDPLRLETLRDRYLAAQEGAQEANTLATVRMHFGHFVESLGARFDLLGLSTANLQGHIDRRKGKHGANGGKLSPVTLRKEMATLRAAWNWATHQGLVSGTFPSRGLVYPKGTEKPPFMTREEIERRAALGGLTPVEMKDLWDSLYLTITEIEELLGFVKEHAALPWLYPLFVFAAHTGARRSEMLRAKVADVDLAGQVVTVHEKKRVKGKRTSRRVPLSSLLVQVLRDWLAVHPGGPFLFCQGGEIFRSKKRSRTTGHRNEKVRPSGLKARMATVTRREETPPAALTKDEAHDHFKRTFAGSKWAVLRGLHTLRHSYISALASKGVDQRLIDDFVGHQTDEQRRRYRHLYPDVKREAIQGVFG